MRKSIYLVVVLLFIITVLIFVPKEAETIKIGFSGPLTGPVARFGDWSLRGAQIAVDEINTAGGIQGRKIELIIEDDTCQSDKAITIVNKMQSVQNINNLIVVCTAPSPAVAPITKEKSIVFSPSFKVKALEEGDYPQILSSSLDLTRNVSDKIQ